jgi:hypothetical protein
MGHCVYNIKIEAGKGSGYGSGTALEYCRQQVTQKILVARNW